ncbi:MAG TPA: heavy metal-associated domain-containing protein [Beijerinckiaceae bacterium]|jgi:copper chaperone|nr:heavy metal-associated domain-containing protein [Beijerinckiaceae bacterium]
MKEERKELIMDVEGMHGEREAEAVTAAIRRLDPSAKVTADLKHQRITVETCAQSLEIAEALNKAGYEAKGMTL